MKFRMMLAVYLAGTLTSFAQNAPGFEHPVDSFIYVGTGQNFLVLPGVHDGDPGVDQDISFTAVSEDPDILEVLGLSYTAGHSMALLNLMEKGSLDTIRVQVEASDADGSFSSEFQVIIGDYDNPGINFEIHDVVFWQQFIPLDANPAFSMIAPDGRAPYDSIDLPGLDLSVYSDCKDSPPCTGVDFFTSMFKGYLKPAASGEYSFYMVAGDQRCMGLSPDEDMDHAQLIIHSGQDIGSSSGNKEWKSDPVELEAGKTYAIYGAHWNIHTLMGGMLWEGPGIDKEYIPGDRLSFVHDVVKPLTPGDFSLDHTGITDLQVSWSEASDDRSLEGYKLYLNGMAVQEALLTDTYFHLEGLQPGTPYCLMVTAVDRAGNESAASSILCTTTYESDELPPTAPTLVEAPISSDLYMKLSWSGASDAETEIRGYRVYVDGSLYNQETLIGGEELILSGLQPEQDYLIEVEAVDAAYNASPKSAPFTFTTQAFDPMDTRISDKKARMNISLDLDGQSDGIGVNVNYKNGEFLNDPRQQELIREHESAAIRWGALTANPLNFTDYIGAGKAMTIARFMNFCNETDAYTVFTCGVEDNTDWRKDPQTFVHFLEYLAGPAESTYGAKRAAEGFTDPLLDESRGLIFEFGNEVWGGNSHDAQIGSDYKAYGQWCREMALLMKASPYYDSTRIFLTYSGRYPRSGDSYGLHESLLDGDRGEVDWLAVSGYMGGNLSYSPEVDPGQSELDYYRNGIAYMSRNLDGLRETMDLVLQYSGGLKPSYFYEANMTNSAYYGRLGQAIVQTDYYASAVEMGGAIPTVFHLTGGQWKMTVPSQDYKKLPLYQTTRYYNRFCKGNVLVTGLETLASVPNYVGSTEALDPVGAHAYASDNSMTVLLISRDFSHQHTVQVDLPDDLVLEPAAGMKYVLTGEGYSAKEAFIDSMAIDMKNSLLVKVPPFSMVILHFGAEIQEKELPMGAFYDYVSISDIEIYAYGTDQMDIEGNAKKVLRVNVLPEDAWSDAVVWSVDDQGIETNIHKESYGFVVEGSRTCAGNGSIKVRATSWDNPELYDEVEIQISGQGEDCTVGVDPSGERAFSLYPNPAGEFLHLTGLPPGTSLLEIRDLGGRVVLSRQVQESSLEIDTASWPSGFYVVRLSGNSVQHLQSFIKN